MILFIKLGAFNAEQKLQKGSFVECSKRTAMSILNFKILLVLSHFVNLQGFSKEAVLHFV